jgi:hypothetical protein
MGELASTMRLTMPNRSKVLRASGSGRATRHFLAIDAPAAATGLAKLLKLAVQGLPVSGYTDIADDDEAFFKSDFRPYFSVNATS